MAANAAEAADAEPPLADAENLMATDAEVARGSRRVQRWQQR